MFVLSDKKIIAAIRERDEQALAFVMRKYAKLLWRVAGSVLLPTASVQDVEECVADVFIYLWQQPEKYDPARAKLSSWLAMVARSRAIDRYRSSTRKQEIAVADVAESLAAADLGYEEAATDDIKEKLWACLAALEEQERELIIRRYYYQQKPAEIALALALPKKQLENKLYYAKQKLKKMLNG